MKLSYILLFPLALAILGVLYINWEYPDVEETNWYLVPLGIITAIIIIFSPQIDWWYAKRKPPKLSNHIRQLLESRIPFYARLYDAEKVIFEKRLVLFHMSRDWKPMGMETIPPDIQFMICVPPIILTFRDNDFLYKHYENIVVYPHPFPSPQFPNHLHNCEHFDEDGGLIFNLQWVTAAIAQPLLVFDICLYEWANVYLKLKPNQTEVSQDMINQLLAQKQYGMDKIYEAVGLPEVNLHAVWLSLKLGG